MIRPQAWEWSSYRRGTGCPVTAGIGPPVNQKFRYCDYYSFMSLADSLAWVDKNDGSEPDISHI